MLTQVLRLARTNVALMPPSEVEGGAEVSGINVIDMAAGDDQYVFLTPWGRVTPFFTEARDKPVLAYNIDDLLRYEPLLRLSDIQAMYFRTSDFTHELASQLEAQADSYDDAAFSLGLAVGPLLQAVQSISQMPARKGLRLMHDVASHKVTPDDALEKIQRDLGFPLDDVNGMGVAEQCEVEDLVTDADEFIQNAAASLVSLAEDVLEWWRELFATLKHLGEPRDLDTEFWSKHGLHRNQTSPELLVPHALPVCEAESVLDRSSRQWVQLKHDVCAARVAMSGIPVGSPGRRPRR